MVSQIIQRFMHIMTSNGELVILPDCAILTLSDLIEHLKNLEAGTMICFTTGERMVSDLREAIPHADKETFFRYQSFLTGQCVVKAVIDSTGAVVPSSVEILRAMCFEDKLKALFEEHQGTIVVKI